MAVSETLHPFNGKTTYGTTPLQAEQWYHVAVTFEADHQKIYLDGVEKINDTDTDIASSIPNNNLPLLLGYSLAENTYFNGLIDDVRIYDNALSQPEIQAIIPEPATLLLLSLGGMMLRRKR